MRTKDVKLLWGKAGGRCSFPECRKELSEKTIVLGEQGHIIAKNEDGPRGKGSLHRDVRDKYENMILLCTEHHTLIDKDPGQYSVDSLIEMKKDHEQWVSQRLSVGTPWSLKLSQVHYLNIPRLSILFALHGHALNSNLDIEVTGDLNSLGGMPLIRIMSGFTQLINELEPSTIELMKIKSPDDRLIGSVVGFDENFRTKNYTYDFKALTGDIERDPYIYKKANGLKWVLQIDPKWITTSTSQVAFRSGTARFAGLAIVKSIKENEILCTPLVLGIEKSEWGV